MDVKNTSDLEVMNQIFEAGNEQIRRTFDLYLELVDNFNEMNKRVKESDKDELV